MENLLQRGVNNLSGGEKQRVSLGRAVLANPRLLLMDEPLSALDDALKFQIIPYLKTVSEQFRIPYLFISHSLVEMRLMAERVLVMDNGSIIEQTTPDQLARNRMDQSRVGYINLLKLSAPRRVDGLFAYRWGDGELLISAGNDEAEAVFEISSKDMILFKRHPEAISARNLFRCKVVDHIYGRQPGRRGVILWRPKTGGGSDGASSQGIGNFRGSRIIFGYKGFGLQATQLELNPGRLFFILK